MNLFLCLSNLNLNSADAFPHPCTSSTSFLLLFFKICIYLAVLGLRCGMQDLQSLLQHVGSFCCSVRTQDCSLWALNPQLGIKPGPPHWKHGVLATGLPGNLLLLFGQLAYTFFSFLFDGLSISLFVLSGNNHVLTLIQLRGRVLERKGQRTF